MTLSKKEEIKLFARLQALYSRLNQIDGDLIRMEAEIETTPNPEIKWENAGAPDEVLTVTQQAVDNGIRKLFLSAMKGRLTAERESIEKQIAEI